MFQSQIIHFALHMISNHLLSSRLIFINAIQHKFSTEIVYDRECVWLFSTEWICLYDRLFTWLLTGCISQLVKIQFFLLRSVICFKYIVSKWHSFCKYKHFQPKSRDCLFRAKLLLYSQNLPNSVGRYYRLPTVSNKSIQADPLETINLSVLMQKWACLTLFFPHAVSYLFIYFSCQMFWRSDILNVEKPIDDNVVSMFTWPQYFWHFSIDFHNHSGYSFILFLSC